MEAKRFLALAVGLAAVMSVTACDKKEGSSSEAESSQAQSSLTENETEQESSSEINEAAAAELGEGIAFTEAVFSEEANLADADIAGLTGAQPEIHSPDAGVQVLCYKGDIELFGESFGAVELEEGERGGEITSLSFLANAREGAGYEKRLSAEECERIYTSLLGRLSAVYGEPQKYDDGLFKGAYFTETHIKNTKRVIIKYCDREGSAGSFVNIALCFEKRQGLK